MATITPNEAFVLGHVLTSKTTKSITTIPLFSVIRTRPRCMQKKGQDSVQQKEQDSVACSGDVKQPANGVCSGRDLTVDSEVFSRKEN